MRYGSRFFYMGSFNCSRTICWKAYPFAISFWLDDPNLHSFCHWKTFYSCCKSTDQLHVSLFLNSLFCSTNLCIYPFIYTALSNFLVLKSDSVVIQLLCSSLSTFLLLLSQSFFVPCKFYSQLVYIYKKVW